MEVFTPETIAHYCDELCRRDPALRKIIERYGYPLITLRKPGFDSMVRLILEQQVSLLSAKAAWTKLLEKTGTITPDGILRLSDEDLRQCYFSRQKTGYVRTLALAAREGVIFSSEFSALPDDEIRAKLTALKGIGQWTADSYLLLSMNRLDIFPIGDIALVNSIRKLTGVQSKNEILQHAGRWRPLRSIATLLFWHAYIIDRNIRL